MPSKVFPAKYAGWCVLCHNPIEEGESVYFPKRGDNGIAHDKHLSEGPAPPASSTREGPKPAGTDPPPVAALPLERDAAEPIYTFHQRMYSDGTWWIEYGVAVKGRQLNNSEVAEVRSLANGTKTVQGSRQ